jgi:hypothetical protein
MKVLFLDSHEPTSGISKGIENLTRILNGYDLDVVKYQSDAFKNYSSIEDFANEFKKEIAGSSLIISTGTFFWLKYFNKHFGVLSCLTEALSSGTPFIFQSVRGWENFFANDFNKELNSAIVSVFKLIGVQPTGKKVFTADSPTSVGGGASAFFRSGDNCFLNADILDATETILINQPNILSYERGAYPVVEVGPLHYLVDSGDLLTDLEIGSRPAVFVEVRNGNMKGFVIGGSFLRDGYESIGGYLPGIEQNEGPARSLVEKAISWKQKPQSAESKLYEDLFDLERGLGKILIARLPHHEAFLLKDAELRDLIEEVRNKWSRFSDLFTYSNAGEFSQAMSSIPAGARRYLSHPIRLEFEPEALHEGAVLRLRNAAKEVRKAVEKLR